MSDSEIIDALCALLADREWGHKPDNAALGLYAGELVELVSSILDELDERRDQMREAHRVLDEAGIEDVDVFYCKDPDEAGAWITSEQHLTLAERVRSAADALRKRLA